MKRICFVYPITPNYPIGGLKVLYQYANYLAKDNYVTIVFAAYFSPTDKQVLKFIKSICKYLYGHFILKRKPCSWYHVDERVVVKYVFEISQNKIPKSDIYIATSANSAIYIDKLSDDNSAKFYFIQGYETFILSEEKLKETYRYELKKIAISQWLTSYIRGLGLDCTFIPNGFDFEQYYTTIPASAKNKYIISMLYHSSPNKGFEIGRKALEKVKESYPQIRVLLFGAYDRPDDLPEWFTYYKNPSSSLHLQINNEAAIYVGTSYMEGWGLTIGEAMMCEQAVVCTDNAGYKEMAVDCVNALLSPVGDDVQLANNIIRLIEDKDLRIRLAKKGCLDIKRFNFVDSCKKFAEAIGVGL